MLIALPFVPESPWPLVRRNKFDDARKALARVYWLSGDDFEQHLARIKDVVDLESHNKEDGTCVDLFRGTNRIRSTILAGFPVEQSFQLGIGVLACGFVGNLLGLMFINRIGRRPLFLYGMVACTLDCLGLAICSLIPGQGALWGQAAFTVIYMFIFEAGIGPVAYALNGELGSAKLRSKTIGWGTCVNSFWIGVLVVIMPYLVNPNEADLKGKVGWISAPAEENPSIEDITIEILRVNAGQLHRSNDRAFADRAASLSPNSWAHTSLKAFYAGLKQSGTKPKQGASLRSMRFAHLTIGW
ncbi:hypothetical protein EHS25_004776 [Saitozyma podzolica]|uniref:Major facilitator superfamily (MFS) profile domain-containing protein n=1 Tax=Saitozyma podzolica TaxID=1890683 RepID=A0A427Y2R5_9TREE|nr:hypothetical protein EHS25_004776 [Saitozyma podzolica]